jgi:hypothetical protein
MKPLLCLVFAAFPILGGFSQDISQPDRSPSVFELSSDMVMFGAPSTRLFLGWQKDVNALVHLGFDALVDHADVRRSDRTLLRIATLAAFSGASLLVNRAFSLTAHDQAHMEAARAIGASQVLLVGVSDLQEMSVWEFFI